MAGKREHIINVTEMMEGEWNYCCRCDEEGVMVPIGDRVWACTKCDLEFASVHVEEERFRWWSDTSPITEQEQVRQRDYLKRLAQRRLDGECQAIRNLPKLNRRRRFLFLLARLLRVQVVRIEKIGGKK